MLYQIILVDTDGGIRNGGRYRATTASAVDINVFVGIITSSFAFISSAFKVKCNAAVAEFKLMA